MGTFNLGLFRPFRSPGSALSLDGRMFSRQAPRQFSVFSLSYKERRAENAATNIERHVRFCGGCFVFSLHGKKRKHKTPQQLTCVASSRNFLPCPLLRKVKKSKQLVREQTKTKNKNGTFSVQEALFYTKLAFPTLTPRVHARLDKPNIECWERVCGGV